MNKVKLLFTTIGAPLLIWVFPVFFLYAKNVKEMQLSEIMKPCFVFIICCVILLLLGRLFFKSWEVAGLFSLVNGLFLVNFSLILSTTQKVVPFVRYWHLLFLVLVFSYLLCRIFCDKKSLVNDILLIAAIVFGALIIFNFITAVPTIITKVNVSLQSRNDIEAKEHEVIAGKRNIYYLLCDEYASFAQLEKDFGYDNSDFKSKLQNLGFNISENSYNDVSATAVVMANIMQLDYIATYESTSVELQELTQNGLVYEILAENGYRLRGIGKTEWLGIEGTVEVGKGATTADGTDALQIALNQSFLGALIKQNYLENASKIVNSFEKLNNLDIVPNESTFTLFYVAAPHHPYYLKADGSMNSTEKWANDDSGKNNDAYIGMVEYVNRNIYTAVERIIENDPSSIIILCSDHGCRFGTVSEDMKRRILNTIYYCGDVIDEFDGMSGVNTLRYVFNREFGLELPYIDLPE